MAKIAFFGTPNFSLHTLNTLYDFCVQGNHELCAVICQPDKRKGRGKKMLPPPTKARALELGISVFQPATLKAGTESGEEIFQILSDCNLDLAIVIAYGRIIPGRILRLPKQGFLNIHASLLPRWRGAAPIQRAIEAGDKETGVCLMDMIYALDEGDIYAKDTVVIDEVDQSPELEVKLVACSNSLLLKFLPQILEGTLKKVPQGEAGTCYAHMLHKSEASLDFSMTAQELSCKVRAMYPWPGSHIDVDEKRFKVFDAQVLEQSCYTGKKEAVGTLLRVKKTLWVQCGTDIIEFQAIQAPGKNRVKMADFLRNIQWMIGKNIF